MEQISVPQVVSARSLIVSGGIHLNCSLLDVMRNIKCIFVWLICILAITGCEDENTDNVSFVTSYPSFEVEGGNLISVVSSDGSFIDPGVSATLDGREVEVTIS